MRLIFIICLMIFAPALLQAAAAAGADGPYKPLWLGGDSSYRTPYYILGGNRPGPVVLIEAGIHGDEIAGILALDRLLPRILAHSGKLIVLPRMNRPAVEAGKRAVNLDLNKVFPGQTQASTYELKLAREIFDLVGREKVQYVITLHESRYLHDKKKSRSFGQTIVYGLKPMPSYLPDWLKAVNRGLTEKENFHPYYFPVVGSSTETMVEEYDLKGGFCVETWRGFTLERRVALMERIVLEFLNTIGFEYTLGPATAATDKQQATGSFDPSK